MCQLVVANTTRPSLNRIMVVSMLQESSLGNTDGTGILSANGGSPTVWKTKLAAKSISNLGDSVRKLVTTGKPVFAHVRSASKGIAVTDENAHPFKGNRFSLAHNGKLYKKDEVVSYTASDDSGLSSDSKEFLDELERDAVANPDLAFPDLINITMAKFKGKFALLVFDSLTSDYYVIRGSSADLHMARIFTIEGEERKLSGFVVNTKKNSLQESLVNSLQTGQLVTGTVLEADPIEELAKNTIYKIVGKDLVKVGDLPENVVAYATPASNYYQTPSAKPNRFSFDQTSTMWKEADKISVFMAKHFLSIEDIDNLFLMFLGKGMADVDLDDLTTFSDEIIPVISASKNTRKKIESIIGKGKIYPITYMEVKVLEYPWMLSDAAAIEAMIKRLVKQSK